MLMGKVVSCEECRKAYRNIEALEDLRDNDGICLVCNNPIEVEDWDRVLASYEDDDYDDAHEEEDEDDFGDDLDEEDLDDDDDMDDDFGEFDGKSLGTGATSLDDNDDDDELLDEDEDEDEDEEGD
jgi:hypothetical protein